MSRLIDPELHEIDELKKVASWEKEYVLEIGCGDGRLARRLADLGATVIGIDSDIQLVKAATAEALLTPGQYIGYSICDGQQLAFSSEAFDIVVFGWSL
jgi:2-polyprenyl-3-methyl-5-hydroxy-6-metoxy-1,4-benzoquinol methylase